MTATETTTRFTLWFRNSNKHRWQPVAEAPTEFEAGGMLPLVGRFETVPGKPVWVYRAPAGRVKAGRKK